MLLMLLLVGISILSIRL